MFPFSGKAGYPPLYLKTRETPFLPAMVQNHLGEGGEILIGSEQQQAQNKGNHLLQHRDLTESTAKLSD